MFLRDGRVETVQRDVNRLANTLISLGVQKGDRVVLFIPKSLIAVVAHFAIQAIGAMAVPQKSITVGRRCFFRTVNKSVIERPK
jgi:acyl-coenzyme A synthetase/AMP-(fatty) acid ligase